MKKIIEIIKDWDGDYWLTDHDAICLWDGWDGRTRKPGERVDNINLTAGGFLEEFIDIATNKGFDVVFLAGKAAEPPTVDNEVV